MKFICEVTEKYSGKSIPSKVFGLLLLNYVA